MSIQAKLCGLSSEETLEAALEAGVKYVGFVFYPRSPRNVSIEDAAKLTCLVGKRALKVGVFVNPGDELLINVLKKVDLDYIQLHGNESIERVLYIRNKFTPKIIKAISVSSIGDISRAREYETKVDMLLFDAKASPTMDAALPGGNGIEFDWTLVSGKTWQVPWMLSGGLNETNVKQAVIISGANIVDASSGIENSPGDKDIKKIKAFMEALQDENNG